MAIAAMGPAAAGRTVHHVRTARATRLTAVTIGLAATSLFAFCLSLSLGDYPVSLLDVLPAVFGHGSEQTELIVRDFRLPRALTGVLVGASFGMSGAMFQSLAHNALASPDIIGITTGASASAVFVIVVLGGTGLFVSVSAFAGSLACALAIYALAYKRGVSSYRLVLVGIGIGAVMMSVIDYVLTAEADIYDAQRAYVWLTGSLNGRSWDHVRPLAIALAVLIPAGLALGRPLRGLQLGDDTAKGIGVGVERTKLALLVVAVALAAVATAAAGPIAFVAFVSPSIARRLVGLGNIALVPAALVGAVLVTLSDIVAREAFPPSQLPAGAGAFLGIAVAEVLDVGSSTANGTMLPVGVVTGIVGGPYLLWLLARSNRKGVGG
jgi:iron complex transport system permease protein